MMIQENSCVPGRVKTSRTSFSKLLVAKKASITYDDTATASSRG